MLMLRLFSILFLLFPISLQAQLNCKITTKNDGGTTKLCYHKNGNVSTNETWDAQKRNGTIKGFNAKGNEIFYYPLRTYAGHASVSLRYYENGQISRVHYSQAPDGGIQFDDETLKFDEEGNLIDKQSNNYPYETKTSLPKNYQEQKPSKKQYKQEEVKEASLYMDYFIVQNKTKKPLEIQIKSFPNYNYQNKSFQFQIKPNQSISFDSIASANTNIEQFIYRVMVYPYDPEISINCIIVENKKNNSKTWTWTLEGGTQQTKYPKQSYNSKSSKKSSSKSEKSKKSKSQKKKK